MLEFIDKLKNEPKNKPKVLLLPSYVVEKIGMEETIDYIYECFGYKMEFKDKTNSQYYFKEIE